jgi:hypothetical protein
LQFWALATGRFFTKYNENDLSLVDIKNYFLCYNRKPHPHRVELYKELKNKNLLDRGIFTLGSEDHKNSVSFTTNTYSGQEDAFKVNLEYSYAIPNDLMSLGNLDAWQTSFLNIVTETVYHTPGRPFLTEKTFKPIIGMRPFLILGPEKASEWLLAHGFKTFNSDFGLPDRALSVDDVVRVVETLSPEVITKNLESIKEKTAHNRKNFFKFCAQEEKRLGIG